MSVLVQFIEWIKQESQKPDEEMMEDARLIGRETIRALFDSISHRGHLTSDSDESISVSNTSSANSLSPVNISPLRISSSISASPTEIVRAMFESPDSDVNLPTAKSFANTQEIQEPFRKM